MKTGAGSSFGMVKVKWQTFFVRGVSRSLPGRGIRHFCFESCRVRGNGASGVVCQGCQSGALGVIDRDLLDLERTMRQSHPLARGSHGPATYERACPEEDTTDGRKYDTNDEEKRQNAFRCEDGSNMGQHSPWQVQCSISLPCFQSLLAKSSI